MKKILYQKLAFTFSIVIFIPALLVAQMSGLHGTDAEYRYGIHAGNNFRTSVNNDGTWGGPSNTTNIWPGEWPINSGHIYLIDGNEFVLSEVYDNYDPNTGTFLQTRGTLRHIEATVKSANISSSSGPKEPDQASGHWATFLPLPGFANPNSDKIAMAKGGAEWQENGVGSWPPFWPDIADVASPVFSPDGWAGSWNGYFGKGKFNADEESYFVADDWIRQKFTQFRPDTNDVARGGLGVRMYQRGLQWSKGLVQDAVFVVTDIKNIGTYQHNKVVFGYKIGNNVGDTMTGGDGADDGASYNLDENLAWTWDNNGIGHASWGDPPNVGVFGGCFLESPGNPFDGIDNDNDAINGPGPVITSGMFQPRTIRANDQIVLIDYTDPLFRRIVTTLADTLTKLGRPVTDTLSVAFAGFTFNYWDGIAVQEIGDNLFDDNLNGVADESRGVAVGAVINYLYEGHKYIDYSTGDGKSNLMIDERRNDGIDNDGNWNLAKDDVGADGIGPSDKGYEGPDRGESDGQPTEGEPHFDKNDIKESDMIGLTAFYLYPWGAPWNQYDDEAMWTSFLPGTFITSPVGNVELNFGSGFFPLPPGVTERFSMGLIAADGGPSGKDTVALFRQKFNVAKAYELNYNFAKAPDIPTVRAYTGEKRVTLFWDKKAEESVDPVSHDPEGKDFEGYKIYRSTSPGWEDCEPITDMFGGVIFRRPVAQFDLINGKKGAATYATQGVHFDLGTDTGLRHFWVDTNIVNGQTYYYAVTSYDHGDDSSLIDPAECSKFIAVQSTGEIQKGNNVVVVKPEAPAAGYTAPGVKDSRFTPGPTNTATTVPSIKIMDPSLVKENHTYRITFQQDTSALLVSVRSDSTASFSLVDVTTGVTVLSESPATVGGEGTTIVDGFQVSFENNPPRLWPDTINGPTWSRLGICDVNIVNYYVAPPSTPYRLDPSNFEIIFGDVGIDTSKVFRRGSVTLPAKPVNFTIRNTITNTKVPFAFRELAVLTDTGKFSFNRAGTSDQIITLLPIVEGSDSLVGSWVLTLARTPATGDTLLPDVGDMLTFNTIRPFLSNDSFEFTMNAAFLDNTLAKADMDKIRVVPNPYVVTNAWEPKNPYSNGRGERQLHFTHLPQKCTIRIFNIRGQLVNTLEHNSTVDNGTEIWNMLSKDNLEIAYGVYIYHVQAEGIGEKIGKIFILK